MKRPVDDVFAQTCPRVLRLNVRHVLKWRKYRCINLGLQTVKTGTPWRKSCHAPEQQRPQKVGFFLSNFTTNAKEFVFVFHTRVASRVLVCVMLLDNNQAERLCAAEKFNFRQSNGSTVHCMKLWWRSQRHLEFLNQFFSMQNCADLVQSMMNKTWFFLWMRGFTHRQEIGTFAGLKVEAGEKM